MKTDRGYIVAMYNYNKSLCVISLDMWDLIENTDEYVPLYRTDNKKDAYKYMKELSSNIRKEPTMVNKQEFIESAVKWIKNRDNLEKYLHIQTSLVDDYAEAFRKAMEE